MSDNRSRSNDKSRGGSSRGNSSRGKSEGGKNRGSGDRDSRGSTGGGRSSGDRSGGGSGGGDRSRGDRPRKDRSRQDRSGEDWSRDNRSRKWDSPSADRPEPSPPTPQYEWVDEGPVEGSAKAKKVQAKRGRRRAGSPRVAVPSFTAAVGKQRAARLEERFEHAAKAFAGERYPEARTLLKSIENEAAAVPEVQELYGLTLYRLGRWKEAAAHLREFVGLTGGSVEQHPVLADCERALGHHQSVDRLWIELREASPSAELVTEGRIVTGGSLADRGDLSAAVALLSKGFRFPRKPQDHHLRRTYALADLYERSGDLPQARELFGRLEAVSPGFVDVEDRLAALG